ncbi:SNF2 family helicase [Penicillium maclennaniae]|uniref:SNF2 family helicase n=1 Tax=Penicillium maclennaniae TaxID=1343394 RepID=UPI0025404AA9|nr:SNF2 family helicase [Penicillium maclennaniae]KAJ5677766.1 SNF2 family helicase [Penicillium maclennaniae]
MNNETAATAVHEAEEDHCVLPAITMESDAIAKVDKAPDHGNSGKLSEIPTKIDSGELSGTENRNTTDLEAQEENYPSYALEAPQWRAGDFLKSGASEVVQGFSEDEASNLDEIQDSQAYPHTDGLDYWNGSQSIPDELEALAEWTYTETATGDINSVVHGADLPTGIANISVPANSYEEHFNHFCDGELPGSDDENESRGLQIPLCASTVSAEISQKDGYSKHNTSAKLPVKKAAASGHRATRKRYHHQNQSNVPEKDINISEREMTRSKELGLRRLIGYNELTALFYQPIDDCGNISSVSTIEKKPRKAIKEAPLQRLEYLLSIGSAIQAAQKHANQPVVPTSESLDKEKALKEIANRIIEKNPSFNPRDVKKDISNLLTASRMFQHPPKMDGARGWTMYGMKRNLLNHQLDGAGWMCDREKEGTVPRGGMLCDMMGLGKTHTTLSCILDDSLGNLPGQMAPTLVIIPGSARGHWHRQISLGFNTGALGSIWDWNVRMAQIYVSNINGFKQHGIVLATYDDVRTSYPLSRMPKSLQANEEKAEWWRNNFESQLGLMHKINWHRIVLDEAQAIRNTSVTSAAVRALTGERKWILTGTPLYNRKEDLQPYFSFLGVPNCELQKSFQDQFSRGHEGIANLQKVLEPLYRRRTFESTCFCLPIVRMPNAKEELIEVEFCKVEKVIYDEILNKQVDKFNGKSKIFTLPGSSSSKTMISPEQTTCILETIVHLRQVSSHFLTAFKAVKPLLGAIESALEDEAAGTGDASDRDSKELWGFIELLKGRSSSDTAYLEDLPWTKLERKVFEDRIALKRAIREQARRLAVAERWDEYDSIVAKDQNGAAGSRRKVCMKCRAEIADAVDFHPFGSLLAGTAPPASDLWPGRKRKRGSTGRSSMNKASKGNPMFNRNEKENDSEDSEDPTTDDWIPLIEEYHLGATWLGSKMTKVRDIIRKWLLEDKDTKIVIFSHFLTSLRILELICQEEKWRYQKACIRKDAIIAFAGATGGASIDLTAANKCIVLDGWWNMAHDEQAFCRLLRIGQDRDVEVLRIIAAGTLDGQDSIDKQMHDMQKAKMNEIFKVMGVAAFKNVGAAKSFLRNMGHLINDKRGHITLVRRDRQRWRGRPEGPLY